MREKKDLKILAIETSCDETAAAVIGENPSADGGRPVLLSNIVSSQIDLHAKTGGVVPEVASRAHMEAIIPVVTEALTKAFGKKETDQVAIQLLREKITHIAVTAGPGLIGSLLVGFNAGKTLAYSLGLPAIPVNHIEGHIYSAFIENSEQIKFPALSLTVSGGHSSLTVINDHGKYITIGETIDDAAGEAFDKVAQLLSLGYPGGPIVSKFASEFRAKSKASEIKFPRPILNDGTLNFSFSGLKTSVLQKVRDLRGDHAEELSDEIKQEICAAFEDAVVDVLTTKSLRAIEKYKPQSFILAGGVAANKTLRDNFAQSLSNLQDINFFVPSVKYCGDNAAMIGAAAYYHIKRKDVKSWDQVELDSNMRL